MKYSEILECVLVEHHTRDMLFQTTLNAFFRLLLLCKQQMINYEYKNHLPQYSLSRMNQNQGQTLLSGYPYSLCSDAELNKSTRHFYGYC